MKKSLVLLFLALAASLSAIPGVRDPLPAMQGEYVYYRDYTFFSETYVGFLQYDDGTIALRYFANEPETGSSEVITFISLNPEQDFIDIIGEKFVTEVSQEDISVVNYLHDMLYEFAGRRKKLNGETLSNGKIVNEDFYQFGGQVNVAWEQYVPLFNLNRITDTDGKILLEAVSFGQVADESGSAFFDYTPSAKLMETAQKKNTSDAEILPQTASVTIQAGALTAEIDDNWNQALENVWLLGDHALLMLDIVQIDTEVFTGGKFDMMDYFARNFLANSAGSFTLLPQTKMQKTATSLHVENIIFTPADGKIIRDIKTLTQIKPGEYSFVVLTIYNEAYQANKAYFDRLSASIKTVNE